jgi:hypothetical protein
MRLGDSVARVATPIARALHMPCIDPATNMLRPESGCGRRQQFLNNVSDSVFEFFSKPKNERSTMQFNVTVLVEADNAKQAGNKIPDEVGEVVAINPRPQQPQQMVGGRVIQQPTQTR